MEVHHLVFSISPLDRGEFSASCTGCYNPGREHQVHPEEEDEWTRATNVI
jgi:hypothetical protein